MKKKILLMVPMLHQGGFERVCIKTARLLQDTCEVTIVIFNDADIAYDVTGLSIMNLDMGSTEKPVKKIWNVYRRVRKVSQIKREKKIDICYSFGLTANLVNVLSKSYGQAWIGVRGFLDVESKTHALLCRRADKIVCCAKMIEAHIRKQYPKKDIFTLYNSFAIEHIRRRAMEPLDDVGSDFYQEHRVLISMGRDDDIKGFWHLLRAFSKVAEKLEDVRLVIIGEGTFEGDKAFAESLGIAEKVLFPGVKRNPFPYIAHSKIYVLTSLSEGFPNALVEAMALGIPVISADCPSGPSEILCELEPEDADYGGALRKKAENTDYGILIPELSGKKQLNPALLEPEEEILRQQIEQLLIDEERRMYYCQAGKKRAEEFSETRYLQRLLENMK